MLIERKKDSFHNLEFEVDLRDYGKVDADISEITFLIKENATDSDDSLFRKRLSQTEISKTANTDGDIIQVSVQWPSDEYGQFTLDKEYQAGLFLQFTGDDNHDENVDESFTVKVIQDFIQS